MPFTSSRAPFLPLTFASYGLAKPSWMRVISAAEMPSVSANQKTGGSSGIWLIATFVISGEKSGW